MLSVLIEGTLTAAPVSRTSTKGKPFTTAQMRVTGEDGETVFCSVIAFAESAAEGLADLRSGDAVAVAGQAALSHWEKNGEQRTGLKVTASRILSIYEAGQRRKASGQPRGPTNNDERDRHDET